MIGTFRGERRSSRRGSRGIKLRWMFVVLFNPHRAVLTSILQQIQQACTTSDIERNPSGQYLLSRPHHPLIRRTSSDSPDAQSTAYVIHGARFIGRDARYGAQEPERGLSFNLEGENWECTGSVWGWELTCGEWWSRDRGWDRGDEHSLMVHFNLLFHITNDATR